MRLRRDSVMTSGMSGSKPNMKTPAQQQPAGAIRFANYT
jgi:hypothetical protein